MLTKPKKYLILIIIDVLFSSFIWYVNASWNNTFWVCLALSTTTFLIIFTPFEIYWSIRDLWFDRWRSLNLEDLEISKVKIEVGEGYLYANLIASKNQNAVKSKNAVIIVSSGFSDTKENLQYYYLPLAYQGYVILAYDARGIGESKKSGKRSNFLKRIDDYIKIIEWIKSNENFSNLKIYSIGISIGAITVLCGGFSNKNVEKIVAISSMSYYKQNIITSHLMVKFSYYMKGIKLSPDEEEHRKLSPAIAIEKVKKNSSKEEWGKFSEKVFLIHTRDDNIIEFNNFEELRNILELSDKNQLILSKGGHNQKKNELALVGATLKFFNE
ncbi:MAG: alpha/beta hydrolase [Promethearchaeota archaeon]